MLFITAGIVGAALAGVIYFMKSSNTANGKVINVEDGFAIDAVPKG